MDSSRIIFILGFFLVFEVWTPVLADGTHGQHATPYVHNLKSSKKSFSEDNMKTVSDIVQIAHDFDKIIYLDLIQYMETSVVIGTTPGTSVTFDLQTKSPYYIQQSTDLLRSSVVQTGSDIYIKVQVGEDPDGQDNYVWTTVLAFCLIVMLMQLMNYKSKFKGQRRQSIGPTELMLNLGTLEEFFRNKGEKSDKEDDIEVIGEDSPCVEDEVLHDERKHLTLRTLTQCKGQKKMEQSNIGQKKKLKLTWCIGIVFIVTMASVLAISNFRQKHVLNVAIPEGAVIRKIRSYAVNPDLSAISLNSSSMSLVTRIQLLRTSCLSDKSQCETYALCDTELGHMTCRCKRGFYYADQRCRACSTSCKDGYYMSRACTADSDVICRPCSTCTGSSYEVAACSGTQDTICIGAAFPVDSVKWSRQITQSYDPNITLTTSDNVFYENLGKIKNYKDGMFIPNNAQVQSFNIIRKTGLKIKIKVSNLYLIPNYIDLDHEDELEFLEKDVYQNESTKEFYKHIRKDFCRNQVPDKYKINLYVLKNHSSAAAEVKCNSNDPDIPQCPSWYKDGETFLSRDVKQQCKHTKPDRSQQTLDLFPGSNNLLCPHSTKLFTETFGMSPEDISTQTFPSSQCRNNVEACQRCLKFPKCGNYEGQCCDINCYTERSCQMAFSDACPVKQVECATGDLHVFQLEPVFSTIEDRFLCHMKYKTPPHLYQIDYTVSMPKIKYTLNKRRRLAKGDKSFNEKGEFHSEFITLFHDAFPEIHDEIILIGTNYRNEMATSYTMHGIKQPSQFNMRKKFNIREHRSINSNINIFSTHVQLEKPFLYGSKSFSEGGCLDKNFSTFYPPQPLYLPAGIKVEASKTPTGAGFEYQTAHIDPYAYIRVHISNTSILKYFEDDINKTSVIGSSLSGAVIWSHALQMWTIKLQGALETCPGYLTVEVYDQFMESKLETFDIFVQCPVDFHLSFDFKSPNTDLPNIFVACINDSYVSHHVLLSILQPPFYPPAEYALTETKGNLYRDPWIPIIVTFILTCVVFAVLFIALMFIYRMKPVKSLEVKKTISPNTTTYIGAKDDDRNVNQPLTLTLFSKPVSKSVFCTLCTLYVVYAFVFTFSMMLAVFYIVQGPLVGNLTIVSNTSAKIHESVGNHMSKINTFEETELNTAYNQTFRRLRACSVHLKENINRIENAIQQDIGKILQKLYHKTGVLDNVVNSSLSQKSNLISSKLEKFYQETSNVLTDHFRHVQQDYIELLHNFKRNSWLKFPKDRFVDQLPVIGTEDTFIGLKDFMKWLEIDGVDQVLNVKETIMNRLQNSMSGLVPEEMKVGPKVTATLPSAPEPAPEYRFGFQILEQGEAIWWPTNSSDYETDQLPEPMPDPVNTKAKMIDRMKDILLPVFICFFISMDILMLSYRFVWLSKTLKKAKNGIDIKVPTDHVAEKIQFWQTGNNNRKYENASQENPYSFYSENKEEGYISKNEPIQLYANTAQKSKQEILRDIWTKKLKDKRRAYNKEPDSAVLRNAMKALSFFYKHLIAPILWRFVLVGAFILVICLITKATSDLVSIETATFLIDTKSIIPQLHRQVDITNRFLVDVTGDLNSILKKHKVLVDSEVVAINSFLANTVDAQNGVIQKILVGVCSLSGNNSDCSHLTLRVQEFATSCNFLPVSTSPFREMDEGLFIHYLHSELVPLVSTLRQILFNTCYIMFIYACLMLVSHMFIRIIIYYLVKTSRLPKCMIYLVSNANDCWKVNEGSQTKSMYRSNSCIESCESGVVGDIEDNRESNM